MIPECLQHFLNIWPEIDMRVLCIGHLTYFIPTLLGQQCSGCPHACPFLALDSCQGCCQQAQFQSYPRTIKSDSSPIVSLSKSLNFPLFPTNSHYKNIVLVQVEFFSCFITLAFFFFFGLPSAISAMSTHHLPCSLSAFSNNLHIMEQPEGV